MHNTTTEPPVTKRPIRVLMTIENYLPEYLGGAEIHVLNISRALRQENCEVKILTSEPKFEAPSQEAGIIRFPKPKVRGKTSIANIWSMLRILRREIKKCDLVHAHYAHKLAFFAGMFCKFYRKPLIIAEHGYGILDRRGSRLFVLVHRFCRRYSLKLAKRIISTSEDLAIHFPKYTDPSKVVVIPNGVDLQTFRRKGALYPALRAKYEGKKILLTVRRFVDKNGVHLLVDAIRRLRQRRPDLNFVYLIIGWGKNEQRIRDTIREYQLEDCVEFIGKIDNDQIQDYLHAADIVLFPSSAESISLAAIEAMVTNNLIVSSEVGGLIELVGKHQERGLFLKMFPWTQSNYYPPDHLSEEIYQGMGKVIEDAIENFDHYLDKIEAGRLFAETHFDWQILAKSTKNLYFQAVPATHV